MPILKPLEEVNYHPINEAMLNVIEAKTQNIESGLYFRVLSAYFLAQMASSMRATIITKHRGKLPINLFVCGLMESGGGKGHSVNVLEDLIVHGFKRRFMNQTYPEIAEQNIQAEATRKADGGDVEQEVELLRKEYHSYGPMPYSFDSGTGPAFKQIRTKAQIAKIGALNMICDEIGTNLLNNSELFAVNLEAYDVGKIKQKITKQSSENKRAEERDSPVPTNMLIFGTPTKLFNGAKEENEFYSLLETGYARRLMFAVGTKTFKPTMTAEELYDMLTDSSIDTSVEHLSARFEELADAQYYNKEIRLERDVALINIEYQLRCEEKASALSKFETVRKAELQHRFFKALKLAGAYAFADRSEVITENHMYAAIKLVEDSGIAFNQILTRDRPYVRLAKYIAEMGKELTHADLVEDLPFYSGSKTTKEEMLNLAVAWGHKNNIIIKRSMSDNIEFIEGESLKETNLNQLTVSYSDHVAYRYLNTTIPFDKLHKLCGTSGYHWLNHHVREGHRCEENIVQGFNMLVLDIDDGTSLETAMEVLKDYKAFYYTTKRHTDLVNRFRVVIPMTHLLKLTASDFKQFMNHIYEWLPFKTDEQTNQRSKKWLCHPGESQFTEGKLLDPLPFIPKTAKNSERLRQNLELSDMNKVERWFKTEWSSGSRNNTLFKYALMLLDGNVELAEIAPKVFAFNDKMDNPLSREEIERTVLRSLAQKVRNQNGK